MTINNYQPFLTINDYLADEGLYPNLGGGGGGQYTTGMMHMFAGGDFRLPGVDTAGQSQAISDNVPLFTIIGTNYGGNGVSTFGLPDLQGMVAIGAGSGLDIGAQSGSPDIDLVKIELPAELGGSGAPVDNTQPSLAVNYLIRVNGTVQGSDRFVGEIVKFVNDSEPGGWMTADGRILAAADYPGLFSVLGDTYGGDGVTTFALPNLVGAAPVGVSSGHPLGSTFGSATETLEQDEMPAEVGGGGQTFDNHGASVALNYIIATEGIYPSGGATHPQDEHFLGQVTLFAGETPPPGWMLCQGQLLPISDESALFSLLGTQFGGDGLANFALPDFTGRTAIGSGNGFEVGEQGGSATANVLYSDLPGLAIFGDNSDETLNGAEDADTVVGFGGNDIIDGRGGDDTLNGGDGDDLLKGGQGADQLDGGSGQDLASYEGSGQAVQVDLDAGTAVGGDVTGDSFASIEGFIGSAHDDTFVGGDADDLAEGRDGDDDLSGGAGDDVIEGGEGSDHLDGGSGQDAASYENSAAAVVLDLFSGVVSGGDANGDSFANIEGFIGSAHNDTFVSGDGFTFEGLGGADVVDGTHGAVLASYEHSGEAVVVDLLVGTASGGDAAGDTLVNVHHLTGSALDDQLTGNGASNLLEGGAGADTIVGGGGVDGAVYSGSASGVTVDLLGGVNAGGDAADDVLSGIESLLGSAFADWLTGDYGANSLLGEGGDDFLNGSAGDDILIGDEFFAAGGDDILHGGDGGDGLVGNDGRDTAIYINSTAAVTVDLGADTASGGDAEGDTLQSIENLLGSGSDDTLTGEGGSNTLNGFQGDDLLTGGAGGDTLIGGVGTDTANYAGSDAAVTVNITTNLGSGGHANNDSLASIESLIGSDHNDVLLGNALVNRLDGGAGDDNLTGGDGGDTLIGGGGNDTANYSNSAQAVSVSVGGGGAGSGALGDAQGDFLLDMENLFGSSGNDSLLGNEDANVLNGWQGDDILVGRDGADMLIGGTGIDDVRYMDSAAGVTVNLTTTAGAGGDAEGDVVISVENLAGSGHDDVLIGDAGSNFLRGGDGDDNLTGCDGADALNGGDGIDTANYSNSGSAVEVDMGAGLISGGDAAGDTIVNVENLFGSDDSDALGGDGGANKLNGWLGNDTLEGFGGDDALFGGLGDDALTGGAGQDTLSGGDGDDNLTGGADADVFFFSTVDFGTDLIFDFEDGVDLISMGSTGFLFSDFAETEVGGSTVLTLTADPLNIITISGVGNALIDAGDFI